MIRGGMTVTVRGWHGVAFNVLRCSQGQAVVVMVGDAPRRTVPEAHCTKLPRKAFCGVCGQVGCFHDGLER